MTQCDLDNIIRNVYACFIQNCMVEILIAIFKGLDSCISLGYTSCDILHQGCLALGWSAGAICFRVILYGLLVEPVVPDTSSEKQVARLEHERIADLERQLSEILVAQTERDRYIVQLTEQLAQKCALLEQAEANVAETKKLAGVELRELQVKLDELMLSRDNTCVRSSRLKALFRKQRPALPRPTSGVNMHASRLGSMKRNLQKRVRSWRKRSPNWRRSVYNSRTRRWVGQEQCEGREIVYPAREYDRSCQYG